MICWYMIWADILIPLIAALIGGSLTLLGVILTIKWEKGRAKEEYLEKIRPFFVVENVRASDIDQAKIKHIHFNDDPRKDAKADQIVYQWDSLLLSNQSESVCMLSYIKVNGIECASFDNMPIKPGDYCVIRGFPLSVLVRKTVDDISIGFLDKLFNVYEYKVNFKIKTEDVKNEGLKKYSFKSITFSLIDCATNLTDKSRRKKDGYNRKAL